MVAFTAIAETVADAYGVDDEDVTFLVMVFFISFMVFNFFAMFALEWKQGRGVAICFRVSAVSIMIGAWGKWFSLKELENFNLCIVSQVFVAIASPFLLNGVGKVSTIWFADNERALALAVGALA
jgi:hypothetical protein